MDFNKDIEDFNIVFLDLETTGLDVVTGDSICEIGAFKVNRREAVDKFHSLINPQRNVSKTAYNIHKIPPEELETAPTFKEISGQLILFLKDCIICAYNVEFDMGFIEHQFKAIGSEPVNLPAIDILSMARDALNLSKYNLEAVANFLKIDCSKGLHRALGDALAAQKIFYKLLDNFKEKGIEKLEDFISLYGFNNEIFKIKENRKILLLNNAIANKTSVSLKCFVPVNIVEERKVLPLRILQENKCSYLWYQRIGEDSSRLRLNRILEVIID